MSESGGEPAATVVVDGVAIELVETGSGGPLLFLHAVDGIHPGAPWLKAIAADRHVIAPWHPGFGHSEQPQEFRSVSDLAYFYLELAQQLDLRDAVLMGASFGGWLAAEVAIRSTERFSHLVLVDPLGIKVSGRRDRDIADMHALSQEQLAAAAYHDPSKRKRDYSAMSDRDLLAIARSREAYTYYGWQPYMHNPGLRRWLRRIRIPTLVVWGESDGIVSTDYGRAFAAEIPGARFELIPDAGHYPHVEQPERFVELVAGFLGGTPAPAALAEAV